jgi:glutamate synthase domain-containing protein 2
VLTAIVKAAADLGLFAVVGADRYATLAHHGEMNAVPLLDMQAAADGRFSDAPMIIIPDCAEVLETVTALKEENGKRVVVVRLSATQGVADRIVWLARKNVEAVNIVFDRHGRETGVDRPRHVRDALREAHQMLVKEGIRDEITLISSGGVGLPEHMAKTILCGADLVAIDLPLLIAIECRLCGDCGRGERCPVELASVDEKYAIHRIVNLMGSWHSQLLEMLGAMGIREARRLRGEVGRCMFFEDLERAAFGRLFGKRKETAA